MTLALANGLSTFATSINGLKRNIGMEVEVGRFGTSIKEVPKTQGALQFRKTSDASVKPDGHELVIAPCAGDKFLESTATLYRLLTTHHAEVNETCGFHVHIDGRDLSWVQIRQLAKVYTQYEREIYGLLPLHRENNQYSKIGKSELFAIAQAKSKNEIYTALYFKDVVRDVFTRVSRDPHVPPPTIPPEPMHGNARYLYTHKRDKYRGNTRYSGLNLNSYCHRGTIEWRQHQGTTAIADLIFWPLFCGWFTEIGANFQQKRELPGSILEFTRLMPPAIYEYISAKKANKANIYPSITIERNII